MQRAYRILKNTYGYHEFRLHQKDIIASLLAGKDVLALMPTGGGKSLCYQIPALVRQGVGIVISPLIALMQDQVDALKLLGIRAAFINSSLAYSVIMQIERDTLKGTVDLLYIAPERLLSERMLALIEHIRQKVGIALFAIDEAHCVSHWGHDFRPEYQQLSVLAERFTNVPRIALTATADKRTRAEIITQLHLESADVYINSFDRPNIHYTIAQGQNAHKQLWSFLEEHHSLDAGIVYCLSRKKVEDISQWLCAQGRIALPYHAGLDADMRRLHQQRFLREEGIIIVATIAFGMGIDKPDVRFVAHLSLPKSVEAYYQETGRAGRDGLPAHAWMAYGLQDVITLRQFIQESTASEQQKRVEHHKLESMLGLCEMTSCRRQALLEYFGEMAQPCDNCDNCLNPTAVWDASIAAQKALSGVYRTGQRFGVAYVINVLLGKADGRILNNQHDTLSTFGIGKDYAEYEWRNIFRQLIALGFLQVDVEGYGGLRLTEQSRPLLRGEQSLYLRQAQKTVHQHKQRDRDGRREQHARAGGRTPTFKHLSVETTALFEALRNVRMRLSKQQGVPPYVIFHDSTLMDMAIECPQTLIQMRSIAGIGERKLERYGQIFLDVLISHQLSSVSSKV